MGLIDSQYLYRRTSAVDLNRFIAVTSYKGRYEYLFGHPTRNVTLSIKTDYDDLGWLDEIDLDSDAYATLGFTGLVQHLTAVEGL